MTRTQSDALTILLCHVRDMLSLAVRYYAESGTTIDVTMAGMRIVVRPISNGYAAHLLVGADTSIEQLALMQTRAYAYGWRSTSAKDAFAEMQDNLNVRRTEAGLFA